MQSREPHLVGRRGGDELVALLVDIPRGEYAVEVAKELIRSISEPARVLGMEVSVTPSVGISFFPQDGIELDSLLNAADAAMYQAKESGRQTYAFYTPTVARRADLRLRLEQRLRKAVEARDFKLVYQPLISLNDGKLVGAEALIRWRDAELGDIPPAEFIPIAEESGLIVALGEWVIHEACRARRDWRMQRSGHSAAVDQHGRRSVAATGLRRRIAQHTERTRRATRTTSRSKSPKPVCSTRRQCRAKTWCACATPASESRSTISASGFRAWRTCATCRFIG